MNTVSLELPLWLSAYWVGVTVVRLIITIAVIIIFGRTAPLDKASKTTGILIISGLLIIWVALAIYLASLNFYRIDMDTPLPPPIAAAALVPNPDRLSGFSILGTLSTDYFQHSTTLVDWFAGLSHDRRDLSNRICHGAGPGRVCADGRNR